MLRFLDKQRGLSQQPHPASLVHAASDGHELTEHVWVGAMQTALRCQRQFHTSHTSSVVLSIRLNRTPTSFLLRSPLLAAEHDVCYAAFRSGRPQAQPVRVQLRASSPPLPAGVAADSGGARLQGSPRRVYGRGDRQKVIFRVLCTLLGNASLDPVISPGQKSAHVHAIVGPVSVGNTIDLANDFQPDVATTCNLKIDMSVRCTWTCRT